MRRFSFIQSMLLLFLIMSMSMASRGLAKGVILNKCYITNDKSVPNDMKEFSCLDTIFMFLELNIPAGNHTLLAKWSNTESEQRENQIYKFKLAEGCPKYPFWVTLNFKIDDYDLLVGPGLENIEFVGNWQVEVYLNENLLVKKEFRVNC